MDSSAVASSSRLQDEKLPEPTSNYDAQPAERPPVAKDVNDDSEAEYDPDDDDGGNLSDFPISHELVMKDHTKVISALAVDPSGARVVSGSHDYDCKLWDFGGMSASPKPFKTWEPAGTYYVRVLLL